MRPSSPAATILSYSFGNHRPGTIEAIEWYGDVLVELGTMVCRAVADAVHDFRSEETRKPAQHAGARRTTPSSEKPSATRGRPGNLIVGVDTGAQASCARETRRFACCPEGHASSWEFASPRQWKRGATHLLNTLIRRVVLATLPAVLMTACGTSLDQQYQQLNAQLSGEIASQQVHIERLQGAVKVIVNSELLFPSGGWQMPPTAAATIAKMAPILASQVQEHIYVNGYTDNTPIGPELAGQGVTSNLILSQKRAETVMNFLISQGVKPAMLSARGFGEADPVASNNTAAGRAQNRRVELTLSAPAS